MPTAIGRFWLSTAPPKSAIGELADMIGAGAERLHKEDGIEPVLVIFDTAGKAAGYIVAAAALADDEPRIGHLAGKVPLTISGRWPRRAREGRRAKRRRRIQKQETRKKAFQRAIRSVQERALVGIRTIDGVTHVWLRRRKRARCPPGVGGQMHDT
jgi:hypothetical protein